MASDEKALKKVRAAIKREGLRWIAGETSISRLSPAEKQFRHGNAPEDGEPSLQGRKKTSAKKKRATRGTQALGPTFPVTWDWRNVGGRNFISPAQNQGNCNTCVSFATTGAIDGIVRVIKDLAVDDLQSYMLPDVSEAQLAYCSHSYQCADLWNVQDALAYATSTGLAPESCFSYTPGAQCQLQFGWQGQITQVGSWRQVDGTDDMRQFLSTKGPLIAGFSLYDDFQYYRGGVYEKCPDAKWVGRHAITIVGYDQNQQAWIGKNSWGTEWGIDGFVYFGYGQCDIDSRMFAIDSFSKINIGPATLLQIADMGQGAGAEKFLVGDVNNDGRAEIIQLWDHGGSLAMIVYGWPARTASAKVPVSTLSTIFASGNMGQGARADAWLIGDVNGDGAKEIIQVFDSSGQAGMNVYGWSLGIMKTLFSSGDMKQGHKAVSWQIADVDGDGKAEIIQLWDNGGTLGMIVYGWRGNVMDTIWSNPTMGRGSSAVSWLAGDINKDGRAEIIQQFNDGNLGTNVYGWKGDPGRGSMALLFNNNNMGHPSDGNWLIGDLNGDGAAEIVQLRSDFGALIITIYCWVKDGVTTLWGNRVGQGSPALDWLIGDVNGDGRAEICQPWANGGRLGLNIYAWDVARSTLNTTWSIGDMGQGSGAESWLIGDVNGNGKAEIIQEWSNNGQLATIVYGYS